MSDFVRITDVAPRDGLQNESRFIPTDDKAELIRRLLRAGVDEIEITSFVSPKWVPQLADAPELCARIAPDKTADVCFSALVPNEKGLHAALLAQRAAGMRLIDKVSVFTAASEEFARRNTAATIAETFDRFRPVIATAHAERLSVRAYVSCAIACPFEGPISPQKVCDVSASLLELGADELDLADTIGAATPDALRDLLDVVVARFGESVRQRTTIHLHDTLGRAGACVLAALERGFRSFDAAAGGLGGCPYASTPQRRAPGNLATEALVEAIRAAGFRARADHAGVSRAGQFARQLREG